MKTNPIILDSTPLPENRDAFAIVVYKENPNFIAKSKIPSSIHSLWDTYEDANEAALKHRDDFPEEYMEVIRINTNSHPLRYSCSNDWIRPQIAPTRAYYPEVGYGKKQASIIIKEDEPLPKSNDTPTIEDLEARERWLQAMFRYTWLEKQELVAKQTPQVNEDQEYPVDVQGFIERSIQRSEEERYRYIQNNVEVSDWDTYSAEQYQRQREDNERRNNQ